MKDKKSKARIDESSEGKSSVSELNSLGSTSSITIPKSSSVKKTILWSALALGLIGGGYFAGTTSLLRGFVDSTASDGEDMVEGESEIDKPVTDLSMPPEALPENIPENEAKDGSIPPVALPVVQEAPATPVVPPVVKSVTPAKKAVVKSSNKNKTAAKKAVVSKKGKKAKAIANLNKSAKKAKAVPKAKKSVETEAKTKNKTAAHAAPAAAQP